MQHNILEGALCTNNTTEGNVTLPNTVRYYIADFNNAPITTISGSDILVLEFDLGHRIHLDRFEYKYIDSVVSDSVAASGISFYFKDESFESYYELTTQIGTAGVFYATLSGTPTISGVSTFAPRYLKMNHTVSGTYGDIYGLRAINNDTIVDFGTTGEKETETIEVARGATAVVRALPIYNSGTTTADALVNLEPTYTNLDEAVYLSLSETGPWVQVFDEGTVQVDSDNFGHGIYSDTEYVAGQLRLDGTDVKLDGLAINKDYGTYTSPVIRRGDASYARVIIKKEDNRDGHITAELGDPGETIEIRYSNTMPKTYGVSRELYNLLDGFSYRLTYRDRWLDTGAIKATGTWYFDSRFTGNDIKFRDYGVVYDQNTNRWAGWYQVDGNHLVTANFYFFNNVGISSSVKKTINTQNSGSGLVNYVMKEMKLDYSGGMWVYFYSQGYSASNFVNATGYYLCYFDSSFNTIQKFYTETENIGNLDVNYDTKELWYASPDSAVIQKMDTAGTITVLFDDEDYTDDLRGLAVLPDGNVVFGNGQTLNYLRSDGLIMDDYEVEDVATTGIDYIAVDGDGYETLWIIDGTVVGLLYVSGERKGEWAFRVTDIGYPIRMVAVTGGVWVQCTESEVTGTTLMKFVSKENRRVDTELTPTYTSSYPTIIYQDYTNINYKDRMPLSTDSVWSSLAWTKIATDSFLLPEDNYYQLRLTFRRQKLSERFSNSVHVTSADQAYPIADYFDYAYSTPADIFWGTWYRYPAIDAVYVASDNLNLIGNSTYSSDSYISTYGVTTVTADSGNFLEVRVKYKIGAGDGVESGKAEHLYLTFENATPGATDLMYAEVYIPAYPLSSYTQVKIFKTGDSLTGNAISTGLTFYEGELRLRIDLTAGTVYAGLRSSLTASWNQSTIKYISTNYPYNIKISCDRTGSNVQIDYVYVVYGKVWSYSDTPRVISIHEQELLELTDIIPNTYKNAYIKTFVSKDLSLSSSASMDVKTRWKVASY